MVIVRRALRFALAVTAVVVAGSCGGSSRTSGTTTTTAMVARTAAQTIILPTQDGMRAAAITYANAFLTGSYRDLIKVLDLQNRVLHIHGNEPGCCAWPHVFL